MQTSFDEFWHFYRTRSGEHRHVRREQLESHPTVTALCGWPPERLYASAPSQLRRCLPPLEDQLRSWLRDMKIAEASSTSTAAVLRPSATWREHHSLAYWNGSGFNRGLRRWG